MTGIVVLILLGVFLFVIEFLLVPGITVAGIGGLILTVFGVYKAFYEYGTATGVWVLVATLVLSAFVIAMSLRARTWRKLMLNTNVEGTVGDIQDTEEIRVGDKGQTISRLAPMGKVSVNGMVREAKSLGGYVDEHTEIEIVQIEGSQIIVKPIK